MNDVSIAALLIGGVIGIFLQFLVVRFERWRVSNSKPLHGTWYEILPTFQGLAERVDKLKIVQDGNRISGRAKRIWPKTENNRRWRFEGYVTDTRLIGFFYINDKKIDPASYQPIIMVQDPEARGKALWQGHYFRPEYESSDDIISGNLQLGEMWWQREKPKVVEGKIAEN